MRRRAARHPPSRSQLIFASLMALAITLGLMELRDYPWSLATLMGAAFGLLVYSGWGTLVQLRRLYGRRSERDAAPQGKSSKERSSRR